MSFFLFKLYLFLLFTRPFDLFAQSLAEYRPMLFLWVLAFVLGLFKVLSSKTFVWNGAYYRVLLAFMASIVASKVASGWAGAAVGAISEFSSTALLVVLVSMNVGDIDKLKSACLTILAAVALTCFMSVYAYHTGFMSEEFVLQQSNGSSDLDLPVDRPAIPALDDSGAYLWRVRGAGFFNDPNDFAQAIVMALPWLWLLYRPGQWLRNLVCVIGPAALMAYAIFLTGSRGAILGGASLMVFGIRRVLGTAKTVALTVALGAVAMVAGMSGGRGFSTQEESAGERIEAWYEGILMLRSHPFLGVGYGNFRDYHTLTAHNSFVLCFAELGLVGFFFWMALLVIAFKVVSSVVNTAPEGSSDRLLASLLRASLVGYLTCAWFLSRTYQPTLYVLLTLCVASGYVARRNQLLPKSSAELTWVRSSLTSMVLAMSLVYGFIVLSRVQG